MRDKIKEQILTRFDTALSTGQPLPLKDIIGMGEVIASFEQNEVAKMTLDVTKTMATMPSGVSKIEEETKI